MFGFGPRLEIGGFVAEYGYGKPGGIRDLSANVKVQLWDGERCAGSVGINDIAGEAINLESSYGVVGCHFGGQQTVDISLGYAEAKASGSRALLDGVFGALVYRPVPLVGIGVENDGRGYSFGVTGGGPDMWRWGGVGAHARLASDVDGYDPSVGIDFYFALGKKIKSPVKSSAEESRQPVTYSPAPYTIVPSPVAAVEPAPLLTEATLQQLANTLAENGLEQIKVGYGLDKRLWVQYQNEAYLHSQLDGLGVALGTISQLLDQYQHSVRVVLMVADTPALRVDMLPAKFNQFLAGVAPATSITAGIQSISYHANRVKFGSLFTPNNVKGSNRGRVFVELSPAIRNFVANEPGVYNQSTALETSLMVSLGGGFRIDATGDTPLHHTNDFDDGEAFARSRHDAGIKKVRLQYLARPFSWLQNLTTYGTEKQQNLDLRVLYNETWLTTPSGADSFSFNYTRIREDRIDITTRTYQWLHMFARADASLSLKYGKFLAGDEGVEAIVSRYFGDSIWSLFWRRPNEGSHFAGLAFSVPLTPRRGMNSSTLMLRGNNRWAYSIGTTVNTPDGRNPVTSSILAELKPRNRIADDYSDASRLSPVYVESHLLRLRDAYTNLINN